MAADLVTALCPSVLEASAPPDLPSRRATFRCRDSTSFLSSVSRASASFLSSVSRATAFSHARLCVAALADSPLLRGVLNGRGVDGLVVLGLAVAPESPRGVSGSFASFFSGSFTPRRGVTLSLDAGISAISMTKNAAACLSFSSGTQLKCVLEPYGHQQRGRGIVLSAAVAHGPMPAV